MVGGGCGCGYECKVCGCVEVFRVRDCCGWLSFEVCLSCVVLGGGRRVCVVECEAAYLHVSLWSGNMAVEVDGWGVFWCRVEKMWHMEIASGG